MSRKPRLEFQGALYHVIVRGNQKQRIFKDEEDLSTYLEILTHYKEKFDFILYAYALMNNHVHLLLETGKTPLSKICQGINQRFTMHFNWKYGTVGHLFQGRYKSIICDRDEYLLSLVKYIHLNPVRAKVVDTPGAYKWSSHNVYTRKDQNDLVYTDTVLRMFSEDKKIARRLYRDFMDEGPSIKKDAVYSLVDQRLLGGEKFVEKTIEKHKVTVDTSIKKQNVSLADLAAGVESAFGITLNEMRGCGKSRQISFGRKVMSVAARQHGYGGKEIAEFMRKDPAAVTRYFREEVALRSDADKVSATSKTRRANVKYQV